MKILPVILAGGFGSRLWPISTNQRPKQFLRLVDNNTLFTKACQIVSNRNIFDAPLIVTNREFRHLVLEEININKNEVSDIIFEPVSKNTAAAIFSAAHFVSKKYGEEKIILILPSDHHISNPNFLIENIIKAKSSAEDGNIITFGIEPSRPETSYGYIEVGNCEGAVFAVKKFIEKPNLEIAEQFFAQENFLWNSGLYLFQTKTFLNELFNSEPEVFSATEKSLQLASFIEGNYFLDEKNYQLCKKISIDYAVAEKSNKIKVRPIPKEAGWNDVGSFTSLNLLLGT